MANDHLKHAPASDPVSKAQEGPPENGRWAGSVDHTAFWHHKTLEELAAEQVVQPMDGVTLDAMGDVWPEDEDLDAFLKWLRKSRQEGRY